ncbi:MAG: hypothetical protein J6L76_00250 [Clostridia bacterium]|nr:hypothetical protein [Clostridia bacterium]
MARTFERRECYVNCAEHLLNRENVNIMFEQASQQWSREEWKAFFRQIFAFGYTDFSVWIPPTLADPGTRRTNATKTINMMIECAHEEGLKFQAMLSVNTFGGEWYFACPNDPKDKARILECWRYYARSLKDVDYWGLFPGDPGGCNRNGCTHITFLELSLEICAIIKEYQPNSIVNFGTWGTPYSGWGGDMRHTENWDGTWAMLTDPSNHNPAIPCHIWNGTKTRAKQCIEDTIRYLPRFPKDTMFSINVGFNPMSELQEGYDGAALAREVAKTHKVATWDYFASEGELICYPHWRVNRYQRKRVQDMDNAPYFGAICYTMTPKMSQLMLYCGAQLMIDPDQDIDVLVGNFSELVFGDRKIGGLMEAFEIVPTWSGYEPRRQFTKKELLAMFAELKTRLIKSQGFVPKLPIFPSVDEYRETLLWHVEHFTELLGENPDRERIEQEYYDRHYAIYKEIPEAADERTREAAKQYADIGKNIS